MFRLTFSELNIALRLFVFLTLVTGVIYPLVVTGWAQLFLRNKPMGASLKKGISLGVHY